MNFPEQEIERATAKEEERAALRCVNFDTEAKLMLAANGFILAAVPFEPSQSDKTFTVDRDMMKMLRENDCLEFRSTKEGIEAILAEGEEYPKVALARELFSFPDHDFAINGEAAKASRKCSPDLTIDGRLLIDLIKAITVKGDRGHRGIHIWLGKSRSDPIFIKPLLDDGSFGIIMPMYFDPKDKTDRFTVLQGLAEKLSGDESEITISGDLLESLRELLC